MCDVPRPLNALASDFAAPGVYQREVLVLMICYFGYKMHSTLEWAIVCILWVGLPSN